MSEATLKTKICRKAKDVPGLLLVRRMTAGNNSGEPDIFGIFNGRHVEIEVKIGDNTPTPLQLDRLRKWQSYGAITGCVWSMTDLYYLLYQSCLTDEQKIPIEKWFNPKEAIKIQTNFEAKQNDKPKAKRAVKKERVHNN